MDTLWYTLWYTQVEHPNGVSDARSRQAFMSCGTIEFGPCTPKPGWGNNIQNSKHQPRGELGRPPRGAPFGTPVSQAKLGVRCADLVGSAIFYRNRIKFGGHGH